MHLLISQIVEVCLWFRSGFSAFCVSSPDSHTHIRSAHSVTRPAGRAAPLRARVEPRALPGTNLSGGVRGGASRVHEAGKPAPATALRTPPRRQQQVRVRHRQARAQPPRRFPAPRDYRSCRGSVAGSGRRLRPEGGAGRAAGLAARGPRAPPAPPRGPRAGRPPRARVRCPGDQSLAFPGRARLKFPDLLSLWGTRVPGDRVARLVTLLDAASLAP